MLQSDWDFVRNNFMQSGLCVDPGFSGGIPDRLISFSGQKIPALLLECSNLAQYRLDILALLLENGAPPFQYLKEAFDLKLFVLGGVVQVDQLTDFRQREPEALAAQGKLEANLVAVAVYAVASGTAWRE